MKKRVSNRQIFFLIFLTLEGFSVIQLPNIMAIGAGTGAWLILSIGAIVFSIFVAIIIRLNKMFKEKTLFEYSKILVGTPLTYIFSGIYIIYFFGIVSMLLRSSVELVKNELLFKTPIWATLFLLVLFCTYAASKGLTNVGRIAEFLGGIIIFLFVFLIFSMLFTGDIMNTLPIFDTGEINAYLKSLPLILLPFLGVEILTMVPLTNKNGKKAIWYAIGSVLTVGLVYILFVEGTYMELGVEDTKNYTDALLVSIRRIDISLLQFLKRLDVLSITAWLFSMFCTITILMYTLSEYVSKLFPKSSGKKVLISLGILVFVLALIPDSLKTANMVLEYLTMYVGLVPSFLIPLILYIVAKVKKYDKKES